MGQVPEVMALSFQQEASKPAYINRTI